MDGKKKNQFRVTSLQDMKMTIRKDMSSKNHCARKSEHSGCNGLQASQAETYVDSGRHTTEPKAHGNMNRLNCEHVDCKGDAHLANPQFSSGPQRQGQTLFSKSADLQLDLVTVKGEPLSEGEEISDHESELKTEPKAETGASLTDTDTVWEFVSETHLNYESDTIVPVSDCRSESDAQTRKVPTILRQSSSFAVQADSSTPASAPVGLNRMLARCEPVLNGDKEVGVREDFVVEIDVAMEGTAQSEQEYTGDQCKSQLKQAKAWTKLPMSLSQRKGQEQVENTEEFVCGVCRIEFSTDLQSFIQHLQSRHGTQSLCVCNRCQLIFSQHSELLEHEKEHLGVEGKTETRTTRHQCEECGMSFTSVTKLRCHTRQHTENKAYQCPDCDKVFTHIYTLTLHKKLHVVKKDHECGHCGKSFHHPQYLKRHMLKHSGERPFVCGQCGKTFLSSSNLAAHMRTHTGEKPYQCNHCPTAFTTSSALTVHRWRHTDAKPFKCEKCERTFTTANTYKRHLGNHTGKKDCKCLECGKTFTQPSSLTIHMRSHTGERPFRCVACGATFAQSAHLTVHVRTHTGERPFVCDMCSASYPRSEYLLRHKRRVHGFASVKSKKNHIRCSMQNKNF